MGYLKSGYSSDFAQTSGDLVRSENPLSWCVGKVINVACDRCISYG